MPLKGRLKPLNSNMVNLTPLKAKYLEMKKLESDMTQEFLSDQEK